MNADVAHISLPKVGEHVNGDAVVVRGTVTDHLFAVIDGLGHGPIAAEAANAARSVLQTADFGVSVLELMHAVHAKLRGTRGAAATICVVRGQKLEACAVGNVLLTSVNMSIPLVLSAGVLGARVPKFRVCQVDLQPHVRLALFSDGISTKFRLDESRRLHPRDACKLAIERHRKNQDDATILIADLDG